MGCEHYSRNCQIKAPCCGAIYPCHWCHDMHAPADHDCHVTMDRTKIIHMVCMHCVTLQPASQHCHSGICPSDTSMAIYYCDICHLWVNDPDILNDVSHCHGCGICRRGGDAEFFHCDGCGVCLSIGLKNNHKCFESRLDCDCPICGDLLMTSRATVIFLKCGHPIHKDCFHDCLEKGMYQCPLCMKSAVDMKTSWERIDRLVAVSPMPDEYKSLKAVISCNDCLLESTVPFRFDYSNLNIDNDVDDDDYMSIDDDNGNE
ncbi:zf-CHY-domain-containing protein [Ramicandelaber brevisporus]|nr:zf-CHY-domain-containing protein [Ramicandelaber brevisporus]